MQRKPSPHSVSAGDTSGHGWEDNNSHDATLSFVIVLTEIIIFFFPNLSSAPAVQHVDVRPAPERGPGLPPLPAARPGELRECYYNLAERGTCSLLATNTSQQECCCTVGEGWGLGCQYHACPPTDTGEAPSTRDVGGRTRRKHRRCD